MNAPHHTMPESSSAFPLDRWYVVGFSWELTDKPIARTILGHPLVLFRMAEKPVALEDRCCHKSLPLSLGALEEGGLRCGYHGLLFGEDGACKDIPGQSNIPCEARVRAYEIRERDQILWIWFGSSEHPAPQAEPPGYWVHSDPQYKFRGDVFHFEAPYQLVHDNLLDLSHLGYVHLRTIGGNARIHMEADMKVEQEGETIRVTRYMRDSEPPPTYTAARPFSGNVDRWQEIDFRVTHLLIWAGAVEPGSDSLSDPNRGGFHIRGFHGVTPETETSTHYFWTVATNPHPDMQDVTEIVRSQSELTFQEDKIVIEAQYRNMLRFSGASTVDVHVDVGPNRARRIIDRLCVKQRC
ncbi:Rieske 2Fe-2S domain-containing protein [Paraburkholderia sediminicola]|uniref:Rieske 2Fe-2S domain-containing protein n=1 Tax=Paraburkholderia sediminicola TaxID=458836 RepID=UPI0038B6B789